MSTQLTSSDLELILNSLEYTKKAFTEYKGYPSHEFKQNRIEQVDATMKKIRILLRDRTDMERQDT